LKYLKKTLLLSAFSLGMIASAGSPAQAQDAFTDAQQDAITSLFEQHLEENPQLVIQAIENYQSREQEMQARAFEDNLEKVKAQLTSDDVPFAGNPEGTITMVEFFDYNCGYCKRAMDDVIKVIENEKDVKIFFKELPILSASSREAAQFALAAHKQGKYFEYHTALMNHKGSKSTAVLKSIGEDLGLDGEQLEKDSKSDAIEATLNKNRDLSRELGIRGTPAFIIGNQLSPGYLPYPQLKTVIQGVRDAQDG
jgi:protein-disulfide isomerase